MSRILYNETFFVGFVHQRGKFFNMSWFWLTRLFFAWQSYLESSSYFSAIRLIMTTKNFLSFQWHWFKISKKCLILIFASKWPKSRKKLIFEVCKSSNIFGLASLAISYLVWDFFLAIFKHCDVAKLPPFLPFKFVSAAAVAAKDSSALNLTGKSPFQGWLEYCVKPNLTDGIWLLPSPFPSPQ